MTTPSSDSSKPDLNDVVQQQQDGVLLRVYVQPKARKEQFVGLHGDRLKVAVTEPPDKGKANEAVVQLIAESVGTAPSNVSLVRGQTSRQKDLLILGPSIEVIITRLSNQL